MSTYELIDHLIPAVIFVGIPAALFVALGFHTIRRECRGRRSNQREGR